MPREYGVLWRTFLFSETDTLAEYIRAWMILWDILC